MNKTLLSTIIATCLTMTNQAEAQNSNSFIGRQTPTINERTFSPEALWAMGRIGGYDIAPDAKSAVYNVSYYSVEQNKSHTVIYTINTDGSGEKLLTTSNASEVAPKYIANGSQIAFLAADNNGTMQIWTMNPNGTERKQISNLPNDVEIIHGHGISPYQYIMCSQYCINYIIISTFFQLFYNVKIYNF